MTDVKLCSICPKACPLSLEFVLAIRDREPKPAVLETLPRPVAVPVVVVVVVVRSST